MIRHINIILLIVSISLSCFGFEKVEAQGSSSDKVNALEARVKVLEDTVKRQQEEINNGSKKNYSLEMKIFLGEVVVLNPIDKDVSKIATNKGNFLIGIDSKEKINNGLIEEE